MHEISSAADTPAIYVANYADVRRGVAYDNKGGLAAKSGKQRKKILSKVKQQMAEQEAALHSPEGDDEDEAGDE
jgi:hypothetical protein